MENRKTNTRYLAQLAILIAIQLVLTITPLGYIPLLGFMDITIMHIPVLVGAVVLGPLAGSVLGVVFGLTSLAVATMRPTLGTWPFSPAMTGSFSSVIIAMVPRILLGLLAALIFRLLIKANVGQRVAAGISAAVGSACNTVFVLGGVYVLLGERYAGEMGIGLEALLASFIAIATSNGIAELIAAVIVCAALVVPLRKQVSRTR